MKKKLDLGKINREILEKSILPFTASDDEDIILGPRVGEDAAIVENKSKYTVVSTDPITTGGREAGWLAVHISANDVAVTGGEPRWFLSTILLPYGFSETDLENITMQMCKAAKEINVSIIGGHTEVVQGIKNAMIIGTCIGTTDRYIKTQGANPGDQIILTKGAGLEGSLILANEYREKITLNMSNEKMLENLEILKNSISVVPEANYLSQIQGVTSMHDPTEGGVFLGLHEIADSSGNGLQINLSKIYVPEIVKEICDCLVVDPYMLLSSGALLATVNKKKIQEVLDGLNKLNIPTWIIGEILSSPERQMIDKNNKVQEIPRPVSDEILRFM